MVSDLVTFLKKNYQEQHFALYTVICQDSYLDTPDSVTHKLLTH